VARSTNDDINGLAEHQHWRDIQEDVGILGDSETIRQLIETIEQVARTDISILITGESGTGKELVAKALHLRSKRRNEPLITVNSGAIPEGILESELFGHEKGSFTGAVGPRKGYFELADRGSIFLDEIGDLPLMIQVKLLGFVLSFERHAHSCSGIEGAQGRHTVAGQKVYGGFLPGKPYRIWWI
jgi:transcriptional regulator with GAF, ATPase, and Fis domain